MAKATLAAVDVQEIISSVFALGDHVRYVAVAHGQQSNVGSGPASPAGGRVSVAVAPGHDPVVVAESVEQFLGS